MREGTTFERRRIARRLTLLILLCVGLAAGCVAREPARPFTLVVLPDTQNYADVRKNPQGKRVMPDYTRYFYAQTRWIKQNREKLNIVMAAHVGDVVQTDHPDEWKIADKAFKTIDGVVPYVVSPGNHDLRVGKNNARTTRLNEHFPPARFGKQPWYGGHYDKGNENNYALFESGGMQFLIIALEFAPRDEVLDWANGVAARHPGRRCIVVTHAYLDNGRRIARPAMGYKWTGNSAEGMWQKFVSQHKNIFLVLSGHAGNCRLDSAGKHGNIVHQVQSNYQSARNGGHGYLRLMIFVPGENRIDVQTYSPAIDRYATAAADMFSLDYEMGGKAGRKQSK